MPKITFVGEPNRLRRGASQAHFCPLWRKGLRPGESVTLPTVPHQYLKGLPHQFMVDGAPYVPPAPEKPKTTKTKD